METQKVPIDDESLLLSDIFSNAEFGGGEDLFSILENVVPPNSTTSSLSDPPQDYETETSFKCKRQKIALTSIEEQNNDGQHRSMSHIAVERNRRKQMNEQLSILRSLMPCFYVKRVSLYLHYCHKLHMYFVLSSNT